MWFCRNLSQYEILHYCGERMHPQEVHRSVCYQEHCDIAMKIEHYLHVSSLLMEIHQHCNAFFFFLPTEFLTTFAIPFLFDLSCQRSLL